MRRARLAICLIFGFIVAGPADAALRPVIVIPGVMGSKLCDRSGSVIWGNRSSYTMARMAALRLPFDTSKRDPGIQSCGLIDTVSIIPLLWESNVYSPLLKTLADIGYKTENILIFDYDWRLSNFDNALRLRDEIERRFPDDRQKIDVVAHSNGGLIARIYLQSLGGEHRLQNFVMLGTPHLGSASVFERLQHGFEHWPNALSGGLTEIQETILSLPSTYQLLPTYDQCCGFSETVDPVHATYADILAPETWSRFSWLPEDYKSSAGKEFVVKSLEEAVKLKNLMAQPIVQDAGAGSRLRFLANGFLDTWSRVFFHPITGLIVGNTVSPGDGTVLLFSATNGTPSRFQASLREHASVFVGAEPELVIKATLSDQIFHAGSGGFSQQLIDDNNNKIKVTSASLSLEPRIVTPAGRLVGTISLGGGEELKGARFSNIHMDIIRDGIVVGKYQVRDQGSSQGSKKILRQEITAPTDTGPYSLRVSMPGAQSIELAFGVIAE